MRQVPTFGGYAERWSDGRLYIDYVRERRYDLRFDGHSWTPVDEVHPFMRSYLVSAAVVRDARDKCAHFGLPTERIIEFLPREKDELIPAELLRLLMDDMGLGMDKALDLVTRAFGAALCSQPDRDWLNEMQPRTARLDLLLRDELKNNAYAFHDAYDARYRSPLGAVVEGEKLHLSIAAFGGVERAELCLRADETEQLIPMQREGDMFTAEITAPSPSALFYAFKINGESNLCCGGDGHSSLKCSTEGDGFRLTVYKRGFETPERFCRSIMYQLFPDRFGFLDDGTAERGIEYHRRLGQTPQLHKSINEPVKWQPREGEADYAPDDFYGGTLRGIAARLPYLKGLGVGTLYLNPIVEARSNHRYDCSNYENVDPILGSVEDYVNLCSEAERLGIAVINDGVFSHTGADSVYFDRYGNYGGAGAYQNVDSSYGKWFDFRRFPDDYRCWWGFKDLPEVNELDPGWQDYIISGRDSIVKLWLRRGASGWRLDVADELPDEVLSLIRAAAKSEKPDSVIIGEVWEDAVTKVSYGARRNYALGYSLDSVMNYPFRAAVITFARGESDAFALRDFLASQMMNYPRPLYRALMNLLSSHDVERLHTALGAKGNVKSLSRAEQAAFALTPEESERATALQKLCAAIQYCVPGVPCLYYGDEECLDGAGDPFDRAPFEPSCAGLHNFYARLGEIRNASTAMLSGEVEFSAPNPDVLIIRREAENDCVACVINRGHEPFELMHDGAVPLLSGGSGTVVQPCSAEIFKLT